MPMDDLFTALKMFGSGVKDLQTSRTIQGANEAVQQIKSSEQDDAEKRAALTNVSQQLVANLGALGTPIDRVQELSKSILPPQYANGMDMYKHGLLANDSHLMSMGLQQQKQEEQPMMDKLNLQNKLMAPFRQEKLNEQKTEANIKFFKDFSSNLDSTAARGRNAFGAGALAIQKAGRVQRLLGDPSQFAEMDTPTMTLVAEGLSNAIKNGVATKEELEALMPKTSGTAEARLKQYFSNKPEPAKLQAFAARYGELLNRETVENKMQTADTVLKRASSRADLHVRDPKQFKITVAENLKTLGLPVEPNDISIDEQGRVQAAPVQAINQQADEATKYLKKSYAALTSGVASPQDKQTAAMFFSSHGLLPTTPPSQNAEILKRKIKMRLFQ